MSLKNNHANQRMTWLFHTSNGKNCASFYHKLKKIFLQTVALHAVNTLVTARVQEHGGAGGENQLHANTSLPITSLLPCVEWQSLIPGHNLINPSPHVLSVRVTAVTVCLCWGWSWISHANPSMNRS